MAARTTWFKKKLDSPKETQTINQYTGEVSSKQLLEDYVPAKPEDANLISSLCTNGMHRPVLDIDFPIYVVPSTTEGHYHLYIEKEIPWNKYKGLLAQLRQCGIIEPGYYHASIMKGATFVRPPWVKKKEGEANV